MYRYYMATSISELPNELNIENNNDNISMVVQEKNKIVPSMNVREDISVEPSNNNNISNRYLHNQLFSYSVWVTIFTTKASPNRAANQYNGSFGTLTIFPSIALPFNINDNVLVLLLYINVAKSPFFSDGKLSFPTKRYWL